MSDAREILQRNSQLIDAELRRWIGQHPTAPPRLIEAIEYSLMAGGKRLRPTLVLESWAACAAGESGKGQGASENALAPGALPLAPSALTAACAIELIHTFSLVHDDLPAMDDDDLRRGKPTNHKVFGEAMAILAGDAMVTMTFEWLSQIAEPSIAVKLISELASASGPAGMIGGQVLDIAGENQSLDLEQLQQIHRMKTGALLTCACRMGAIAADASKEKLDALTEFGRHLGLAFQIVDDLLDVTSTAEQMGKAANKDVERGKNTYPALLGLNASLMEAQKQLDAAINALEIFGEAGQTLRVLAKFVVQRTA